jgi:hypothetical protein
VSEEPRPSTAGAVGKSHIADSSYPKVSERVETNYQYKPEIAPQTGYNPDVIKEMPQAATTSGIVSLVS